MPDCRAVSLTDAVEPKTFYSVVTGANNLPVSIDCWIGFGNRQHYVLDVRYAGRNLYLTDTGGDTVLAAKLDECGRPLTSSYREDPHHGALNTRYYYNIQGRLSKFVWSGALSDTVSLDYDHRGNLLSISREFSEYIYTYDYSKPVEKGVIYTELRGHSMDPVTILEWLGHFDLRPRNLRISSETLMDDGSSLEKVTYGNYIFDGAKVYSYEVYKAGSVVGKYSIGWDCNNTGGGAK